MKIKKKNLRKVVRENIAMRMTMDRMRKSDSQFSEPEYQETPRKRRPRDPITDADIVKGAFKGTTRDRAELTKKLRKKIEKLIDDGYENNVPSNWEEILGVNNEDALAALSKVIFPGFFGTIKRTLFPEGKITKRQLRRIIREAVQIMKPSDSVDTFDKMESLQPGDKITINGRSSIVIDVNDFSATLTYVTDGKATLKDLDYRLAVRYDDDPADMLPEIEITYMGKGQLPQRLRQPPRKKGPGRSYSVMD